VVGANPDVPGIVFFYVENRNVYSRSGTGLYIKFPEIFFGFVINVDAPVGSRPDPTVVVFEQRPNCIVADGSRRVGFSFEYPDGISIVPVQAGLCSEPHKALFILQYGENRILRKSVFDGEVFKIIGFFFRAALAGEEKATMYAYYEYDEKTGGHHAVFGLCKNTK